MKKEIFAVLGLAAAFALLMTGVNCASPDAGLSVRTDKADYAPEEIVTIFGTGFSPGRVILTVTRPDGEIEQVLDVSADSSGSFTATYLLDGIMGTYIVNATDSAGQTAQTTFTDGANEVYMGPQEGTLTYGTPGCVTYNITVYGHGQGGHFDLWVEDLPSGAIGSFDPSHVEIADADQWPVASTLTICTNSTTPVGTFTIKVIESPGQGGGHFATGTLTIGGCVDADGDGYGDGPDCTGPDCDDSDASVHPGATEVCNGIDDDCDGSIDEGAIGSTWYQDVDGDNHGNPGVSTQSCTQPSGYVSDKTDCSDSDSSVYPGAPELCDGKDNDCDGAVPADEVDSDGDGAAGCLDCDDGNGAVHPGATEVCNGIDDDCDGSTDEGVCTTYYKDHDGDTYGVTGDSQCLCAPTGEYTATVGGDCDDNDAKEHPGQTWYKDADNDGYSDGTTNTASCTRPAGYKVSGELTATSGDCDDSKAAVHPGATEVCNGIDDDCDGSTDEGVCTTYYKDHDGDTYGVTGDTQCLCAPAGEYTATVGGDCDDNDANEHPGQTWYKDADNDGYSDGATNTASCTRPAGYKVSGELMATSGDCNDSKAAVHPGATEVCNGIDDDCDGSTDEGVSIIYYRDFDGDGYGNATATTQACSAPGGYVSSNTDCNDNSSSVHPGATEVCNGIDDDCDGNIDEGVSITYYRDFDSDGYGNATATTQACSAPVGYVSNNTDCNDNKAAVYPGATEVCNGIDDDCDGSIDEGVTTYTWYRDADGDGYGNPAVTTQNCTQPSGYVSNNTDCNDGDNTIYTGAPELCDGKDNDCDGSIDEGGGPTWYRDSDGDGYGNAAVSTQNCTQPAGYVASSTDCNDSDNTIYPGAPELADGKDNDCDGSTDEGIGRPGPAGPIEWWILVIDSTEGGKVTEPTQGNFPYGAGDFLAYYPDTVVELVAVPDAGYRFVGWTGAPDIIADVSAATTTINMSKDCAIVANFAEIPETPQIPQYDLTVSSTAGGSVSIPGEGTFTYDADTVLDLVAEADSGYKFVNWTGDVTTIANVNGASTTITMNDDYSVVANFEEIPPNQLTLTVSSSSGGSVTTPGEATFTYYEGTVVNLKAQPDEGYEFVVWIGDVDDVTDVTAASTTITMNYDYSITATFRVVVRRGPCFIATAAYGTPMAGEIQILRDFRDEYLVTNPVGKSLVEVYYTISPPIAELITEHPSLKPIVRAGLAPAVAMSTVAINTTPAEKAAILGLSVLLSVALAIWATRRRAKGVRYA